MAKAIHTCTGCVPIDASIIEAYVALITMNKNVSDAEDARVEAEDARALAENARVEAEGVRAIAETERERVAGEDHETAVSDHGIAVLDNETATADHNTAVLDHETAVEDHNSSTEATTRANEAAAAAEHMVDIKRGPKGDQGNTGSSVDYPYELVNNVTTDDATKGLSAAQGVVLDGKISQLGQYEDNPEFLRVVTDSEGNILYGVKPDGDIYFGAGTPSQVQESISVETARAIAVEATKVDKIEGKGLSSNDYDDTSKGIVDMNEEVENPEWDYIITDPDKKTLLGINKKGEVVAGDVNISEEFKSIRQDMEAPFDKQLYKEVFKQEANNALNRFLPFTCTAAANALNQQVTRYRETCNLLFFSDSHIDYFARNESQQNVDDVVDFANAAKKIIYMYGSGTPSDEVNPVINSHLFDAVIHGGDVLSHSNSNKSVTLLRAKTDFFDKTRRLEVPFLFSAGNHDRNDSNMSPDKVFSAADWAWLYGDYASNKDGIVREVSGSFKSPWFYYDISKFKIRIISVFINDVDSSVTEEDAGISDRNVVLYNESRGYYISQRQMDWIINHALNFSNKAEKDWGVIIVSHASIRITETDQPFYATMRINNQDYQYESALGKLHEVLKAFNAHSSYSDSYTFEADDFFDLDINADFTDYADPEYNGGESHTVTIQPNTAAGERMVCSKKAGDTLNVIFKDESNQISTFLLYVQYVGDSNLTSLGSYSTNTATNITLEHDITDVYFYVSAQSISAAIECSATICGFPHVICWLNGHEHTDYNLVRDGINYIWTAHHSAMMAVGDLRINKVIGTSTQNLFDMINIDTLHRKIRMVRVGAGETCFGREKDRFLPDGLSY